MTIKNILIHADNDSACELRIHAAMRLAKQHQAQLSSVYAVQDYFVPTYYESQISPEIIAQTNQAARERATEAQSKYQHMVEEFGLSLNTTTVQGNLFSTLCKYARYADLLVVGQNHPDDPDNLSESLADNLVLEGGPPCLVVPYNGSAQTLGERILVAWNGSREAARALRDSLPLLHLAKKVEVMMVNPNQLDADTVDDEQLSVIAFLRQHGIKADQHQEQIKGSKAGDAIISRAAKIDADLIVMGAYGHSRLRELVLGGTTLQLLKDMPVPLFISH